MGAARPRRCAPETLRRPVSGRLEDLPRMSFGGPSRAFPGLVPGEVEDLFEPAFRVEVLEAPTRSRHIATYLLERSEITHV
jgi:hypothetical protein